MKSYLNFFILISFNILYSQSFIHQLKPIYWQSSDFNEQKNYSLNGYEALKDLNNFSMKVKNVTVFFVAKGSEEDFNKILIKDRISLPFYKVNRASLESGVVFAAFLNSQKKKDYIINFDNTKAKFYEIIIFDYNIEQENKLKIETYLSLKYGVSLSKSVDYINSNEDVIWNNERLINYNENVTGVGIFKDLDFEQLKSANSEDATLEIVFKPKSSSEEKYLIFGNNNRIDDKIWFLKKRNIDSTDKFEFRYYADDKDLTLILSKDENFIENTKHVSLFKIKDFYTTGLLDLDKYEFFKFCKLDHEITNELKVTFVNEELTIYPNPNNGDFYLNFNFNEEKEVKYKLIDNHGKVITQKSIGFVDKHLQHVMENLPSGTYLLKVEMGNEIQSKIVIIK